MLFLALNPPSTTEPAPNGGELADNSTPSARDRAPSPSQRQGTLGGGATVITPDDIAPRTDTIRGAPVFETNPDALQGGDSSATERSPLETAGAGLAPTRVEPETTAGTDTEERSPFQLVEADTDDERGAAGRGAGTAAIARTTDSSPLTTTPSRPVVDEVASDATQYVVKRGDTLQTISLEHYGTHHRWRTIADANQVDPMSLRVGDTLTIPPVRGAVAGTNSRPAATTTTEPIVGGYRVKRGDSYYTIARDQLGDASRWQEVQAANDIDPRELRPGMTIRLPGQRTERATAGASVRREPAAVSGRTHTVKRGEYLSDIAATYYGSGALAGDRRGQQHQRPNQCACWPATDHS